MPTYPLRLTALVVTSVVLVAACGDDDTSTSERAAPSTTTTTRGSGGDDYLGGGPPGDTTTTAAEATADVALGETSLGDSLVDADGSTLYVFMNDTDGVSACNAGCVEVWPPLTVEGAPAIGPGLDASLFSTITRGDGSAQLVIDGRPLYRFTGDSAPGDENGQGVGDLWYVAGPGGEALGS